MKKEFLIIALFANVVAYGQGIDFNQYQTPDIMNADPNGKEINTPTGQNPIKDAVIADSTYTAGFIYYDAVKLSDSTKDTGFKKKLLKSYGIDNTNYAQIPYFKGRFGFFESEPSSLGQNAAFQLFSSLGNIDVTYFSIGLSRFLAERAKEELNEVFFNGMKDKLKAYPELQVVFPQTWEMMKNIDSYGYAYIIQLLKDAFETDMRTLPQNFNNIRTGNYDCSLIDNKKDSTNCENRKTILNNFFDSIDGCWLSFGLSTLNKAFYATNPADLLQSVVESSEIGNLKKKLLNGLFYNDYNTLSFIELSNCISQSLRSKEANQVWITPQQLDTLLFKQPKVFEMYLGLLLAKEQQKQKDTILFYQGKDKPLLSFANIISDTTKMQLFRSLIQNCHYIYNAGNNAVRNMQAAVQQSKDADTRALYDFYHTLTNTIRPLANSIGTITKDTVKLTQYDRIEKFLNPAVDMVYHIADKKYSSAIFDAYILIGNIKDENGNDLPVRKSFIKYGTLIANVASAQNSDEVKKAIAASAMPAGSSAIKRNSLFSVMFQAYVGGYGGTVHYKDSLNKYQTSAAYGIFAPIGISLNTGSCKPGGGAVSLNFQLLDLGSLVNFYLKKGENAVLPTDYKVNLIDIFSPGVQLGYLFPRTPLTAFIGTNYIPVFYKIAENTYHGGWRWQIGVAVDIPLFKLHIYDK